MNSEENGDREPKFLPKRALGGIQWLSDNETLLRPKYLPSLGVIEGLSCAIELFCRYGLAATLGQHCL